MCVLLRAIIGNGAGQAVTPVFFLYPNKLKKALFCHFRSNSFYSVWKNEKKIPLCLLIVNLLDRVLCISTLYCQKKGQFN